MKNTRLNSNPSINELAITIDVPLLKQNKIVMHKVFWKREMILAHTRHRDITRQLKCYKTAKYGLQISDIL